MNLPAATMFQMPDDGWFQLSATGSFPHATTGLVQVIDDDAIAAIVQKFTEEATKPNFPGVLVDWDHSSLDLDKPTEAAGWIVALQQRPDGLWGQVRWSDRGAEAVSGGRYRFMSPVWRQEDCLDLGEKKVRPLRLFNCALTNDPNIKGMVPLANSGRQLTAKQLRFLHAQRGGGGSGSDSGGDSGGTGDAPAVPQGEYIQTEAGWQINPAFTSTPQQAAESAARRGENPKIAALKNIRTQLEAMRQPSPEPPAPVQETNTRALKYELARRGAGTNEINAAVAQAEASNRAAREAERALHQELREAGYATREEREQVIEKIRDRALKDFEKATEAWRKREEKITAEIGKVDVEIGQQLEREENARIAALSKAEQAALKREDQAARAQVARDKEEARLAAAEQRRIERENRMIAADQEKNDPQRVYRAALTKRRTYWDALSRGDQGYAERIYPGADHQKNAGAMKEVSGWKDKAARLRDTEPM